MAAKSRMLEDMIVEMCIRDRYTYSQSRERTYDIEVKNRVIKKGRTRFTDFPIAKKR